MSSVEVAANGPDKSAPAPVGMVTHLKHLIESLPVCVMRSDLEGCLLAANDSALQLLGVTEHAKVLGKSLSERISAEHAEDWRGFLRRGWNEGASSVECELVDFAGAHRIILIKSVAQPTHADGIQSLILTAQDLSSRRRLERALNEHQGCATTIDALQVELQQSETERQRLMALLETLQTEAARAATDHEAASEPFKRQIEELQTALAAREQEWQKRCDELTAQLAEQRQLAALMEQRDAEHQRLLEESAARDAEHKSTDAALRARIVELEDGAIANDREWQKRCDDLAGQLAVHETEQQRLTKALEERDAEQQELTKALEERDAERQQLAKALAERDAEHQRQSSLLEQAEAERLQLATALASRTTDHQTVGETLQQRIEELERSLKATEREWQKRCDDLTAHLAEHAAARLQLSSALAQRDEGHQAAGDAFQRQIDELERLLKTSEQEWQKRSDELATQLAEVSVERDQLSRLLEQRDTDHQTAGRSLQQRIEELERALKANDAEWQARRVELTSELAAHVAEHERLSAVLKQRDADQQQLSESLRQRDSEHQRLTELLKQHESELQRVSEVLQQRDLRHQADVENLHQQIAECERALTANDEAWKQRCEELASELTASDGERKQRWEQLNAQLIEHSTERQRLSDLLEDRQVEQQRLVEDHAQEKIRIEQTVRSECDRALADVDARRRHEIEALRTEMQRLAGELQRTAEQLAQRTAEYDRLTANVHARDAHEPVDPADLQRLMKSVAAYRIELVQITENTIRTLEPMATAGRVAIASSRELQAAVEAVDARSRQLLAQCALDDVNRPEIECLRRDSIGAASLVRQLVQVFGESLRSSTHGPGEPG
jgi:PAS domain S-box-containing protein